MGKIPLCSPHHPESQANPSCMSVCESREPPQSSGRLQLLLLLLSLLPPAPQSSVRGCQAARPHQHSRRCSPGQPEECGWCGLLLSVGRCGVTAPIPHAPLHPWYEQGAPLEGGGRDAALPWVQVPSAIHAMPVTRKHPESLQFWGHVEWLCFP